MRILKRQTTLLMFSMALCIPFVWGCSDDPDPIPGKDSGVDTLVTPLEAGADMSTDMSVPPKKLIILHTNDMHDHLMGWSPNADFTPETTGDDVTLGGLSRLATLVKSERAAAGDTPVLLLDGGDFSMGSLFSLLNTTSAPILTLMQMVGYDAMVLGNHEFDWTPKGLAGTLAAAVAGGFQVPVLLSNIQFDDTSADDDELKALMDSGVIVKKLIKELPNGLKVGFFGLIGEKAVSAAPNAKPLTFADATETATAMIKELREEDQVDLVICLSHSGINEAGEGEDQKLAEAAPGIDVIISGHTHVATPQAITEGKTLIVQTGYHAANLGKLELSIAGGMVSSEGYALIPVEDTVEGDTEVQAAIDGMITALNTQLTPFNLAYDQVVAETAFDLTFPDFQETILGNIITDASRAVLTTMNPLEPIDVSIESGGVIRDQVLMGKTGQLWFADLFRALPLGIGPDGQPGYPMISFYMTSQELRYGMEILAAAKTLQDNDYFFSISGMEVTFDEDGDFLQRITGIKVGGNAIDIADTATCHHVATNLYIGLLLGLLEGLTYGAFKIDPKESDCTTVIQDITTRVIDGDPATDGVQELKQWQVFLQYLTSFPDTNGNQIPDIPDSYATTQGRIIVE